MTESQDTKRSNEPTLLGIPQELRNKNFEYVYDMSGAIDGRVDLLVTCPTQSSGCKATITSHQTLPSKDPIMICRQLYLEMGSMQRALYRQFWTTNTFHVSFPEREQNNQRRLDASSSNLRHVKHFIVSAESYGRQLVLDTNISREGALTADVIRYDAPSRAPHVRKDIGQDLRDQILLLVRERLRRQDDFEDLLRSQSFRSNAFATSLQVAALETLLVLDKNV